MTRAGAKGIWLPILWCPSLASNWTKRTLVGLLCLAVLVVGHAREARAQKVAVLTTDSLISTLRTISGAIKVVQSQHPEAVFIQYLISPDSAQCSRQIDSVKAARPAIILTVGSGATECAKDNFTRTPIVFSAVMYPVVSGFVESLVNPGHNITGASLNIPVNIQFRNFRKIIPKLRTIGVLYSSNTAKLIPPSKVVAQQLGLDLVALEVNDQKELPRALDSLTGVCDGIWSVADPNLFSPQSTKFILLHTIRRGVPFMGFSRYVVESGALFALDFDYKAVGRQAGKTVNRILEGTNPGGISITSPDIIWFHYNEKTARHISVTIPDDMIAIAKEVYR